MAIAEQEVIEQEVIEQKAVREIRISISREQEEALTRAASQTGQSLEEFAASALSRAAEDVLNPTLPAAQTERDPLDGIIGIFKDEPLLDALMERIHEDRRAAMEAEAKEAEEMEAQG